MNLAMNYGWTFDEIAEMTMAQIVVATNPERKGSSGGRKKNPKMMPINSGADVQAFLSRQDQRRMMQ